MIDFREIARLKIAKSIELLQRVVVSIRKLDGTTAKVHAREFANWLSSNNRIEALRDAAPKFVAYRGGFAESGRPC